MNFYFTFGTSPKFPYGIKDYVKVIAKNQINAEKIFMLSHPGPDPNFINCAFVYTQKEWDNGVNKYYKDKAPVEIIDGVNWEG